MIDNTTIKEFKFPQGFRSVVDTKLYLRFLNELCENLHLKYAMFSFPSPWNDLLKTSPLLSMQNEFCYYWEKPADDFAIAASGTLKEISASGANRFDDVYATLGKLKTKTAQFNAKDLNNTGIHFLGGFSFFDEPNSKEWNKFGASSFVMPKRVAIKNKKRTTLSIGIALGDNRSPKKIHRKLLAELDYIDNLSKTGKRNSTSAAEYSTGISLANNQRNKWTQTVIQAKNKIRENCLEKVVMARQLKLNKNKKQSPVHILDRLRIQYPNCSTFLIKKKNSPAFIGCSPEKLLSFHGNTIHTEALAGTIARGENRSQDENLGNQLMDSAKNNEEHRYVVQSIKQDLTPFVHELKHGDQPIIKKLANVQHLYTPIRAKKKDDINPLALLGKLHPTPAVGGYPRKKAVRYIRENESFNRGWFASPVGWINSKGEGEFTVAIRSGLIDDTDALLFAGCGIVADSDPENEWQETNLKFMPMLSALNYD